jgi:hypothetical protein
MSVNTYKTEYFGDRHILHFTSEGKKSILKRIEYALITNPKDYGLPNLIELYNLGFGDVLFDSETNIEIISDSERSNNGNKLKVLNTVAYSVLDFFKSHPDAFVYVEGNSPSRNREYRIGINKIYNEVNQVFEIARLMEDDNNYIYWEDYKPNRNYYAFLIRKK